jgi:hypothetical protein
MSDCDYLAAGGCGNCIDAMCCTELMACDVGSMQCQAFLECLVDGTSPSECASMHTHPSTGELANCIEMQCDIQCA